MFGAAHHLVWNLFLAFAAVVLAHLAAQTLRAHHARRDARLAVPLAIALAAWVLVLPNTCYLFTEIRHLFEAIDETDLWRRAHHAREARVRLLLQAIVQAIYASTGALTFGLAIRPVRRALEDAGLRWRLWLSPLFFVVVAFGVYLGLVLRLNSWDVLTRPDRVLTDALLVLRSVRRMTLVALGGGVLFVVHEIVDVWIDGAGLRWRRLRSDAPSAR